MLHDNTINSNVENRAFVLLNLSYFRRSSISSLYKIILDTLHTGLFTNPERALYTVLSKHTNERAPNRQIVLKKTQLLRRNLFRRPVKLQLHLARLRQSLDINLILWRVQHVQSHLGRLAHEARITRLLLLHLDLLRVDLLVGNHLLLLLLLLSYNLLLLRLLLLLLLLSQRYTGFLESFLLEGRSYLRSVGQKNGPSENEARY